MKLLAESSQQLTPWMNNKQTTITNKFWWQHRGSDTWCASRWLALGMSNVQVLFQCQTKKKKNSIPLCACHDQFCLFAGELPMAMGPNEEKRKRKKKGTCNFGGGELFSSLVGAGRRVVCERLRGSAARSRSPHDDIGVADRSSLTRTRSAITTCSVSQQLDVAADSARASRWSSSSIVFVWAILNFLFSRRRPSALTTQKAGFFCWSSVLTVNRLWRWQRTEWLAWSVELSFW